MSRAFSDADLNESLITSLDQMRHELTVLRMVLDDIRDQLEIANQERDEEVSAPNHFRRLTSMPLDPCAPDWSERLNQFSAADVDDPENLPIPKEQGELF